MLAFTRANNCIRQELINLGLITKIPWSASSFLAAALRSERDVVISIGDTSFVDDLVLPVVVIDSDTAIEVAGGMFFCAP